MAVLYGGLLFAFLLCCGSVYMLYCTLHKDPVISITYGNEPYADCEDCGGKGVIHEGHEHFETECPCTMRINGV